YLIATSRACIAESKRHIEHSNELIAETQATIDHSRALLAATTRLTATTGATTSPQRITEQIRITEESEIGNVWSLRVALRLLLFVCLGACAGVGLLIAGLTSSVLE